MKKSFFYLVLMTAIFAAIFTSCAKDGEDGKPGEKGEKGDKGDKGDPGANAVITISDDGYWVINGVKTTVKAQGEKGDPGEALSNAVISISDDGYWVINGVKTGTKAQGEPGPATAITISADGYWVINGVKTDTKAQGEKGDTGATGAAGASATVSINEMLCTKCMRMLCQTSLITVKACLSLSHGRRPCARVGSRCIPVIPPRHWGHP